MLQNQWKKILKGRKTTHTFNLKTICARGNADDASELIYIHMIYWCEMNGSVSTKYNNIKMETEIPFNEF